MPRKKKTKLRVKREPKPPTWITFMCVNHTREEVYFGVSMNRPKWTSSRSDLSGIPELAHWDIWEDRTRMSKLYKRKPFPTKEAAQVVTRNWERWYDHNRNFWVIQTGLNLTLSPRERKPVKPPRVPRDYRLPDIDEENEAEEDDAVDFDSNEENEAEEDDDVDFDSDKAADDEELDDEEISDGLEFEQDHDFDPDLAVD